MRARAGRAIGVVGRVLRSRGAAAVVAVLLAAAAAATVLGAEPGASPGIGGDPRSPGQGPGLVGDPVFAIGAVLVIGLLAVGLTIAWVRLTGGPAGREGR